MPFHKIRALWVSTQCQPFHAPLSRTWRRFSPLLSMFWMNHKCKPTVNFLFSPVTNLPQCQKACLLPGIALWFFLLGLALQHDRACSCQKLFSQAHFSYLMTCDKFHPLISIFRERFWFDVTPLRNLSPSWFLPLVLQDKHQLTPHWCGSFVFSPSKFSMYEPKTTLK